MTPQSHRIAVNGVELHYLQAGSGAPVVLLHGFPESSYSWRRQIPALTAAGFRVIAPDLRGYGDSSKPVAIAAYKLSEIAKDIIELIEKLAPDCVLVGHDWGAVVAWYVAMTRPDLLRKLVVLNVAHPAPLLRELKRSVKQKLAFAYQLFFQPPWIPEALLPVILPRLMRRAGRFTREDIEAYRIEWQKPGAYRAMANYYRAIRKYRGELRMTWKRIEIPTLLVWAEHEPVFRRATTEDFDQWVPDLRIARVGGAGHFVQTDEPEIVSELLVEFASGVRRP
jgi:epoxide hydrolase 4